MATVTVEVRVNNAIEMHVIGADAVWHDGAQWMARKGQNTRPVRNYCGNATAAQFAVNKLLAEGLTIDAELQGAEWLVRIGRTRITGRGRQIVEEIARDVDPVREMALCVACLKAIRDPLGDEL